MVWETVVICPVCTHQNAGEAVHCVNCWASLTGARALTPEEGQKLKRSRLAVTRRGRWIRWSLVALILLGIGAWIGYVNLGAFRTLPPPASTISAAALPGNWPMYQRDPSHTAFTTSESMPLKGELKWVFNTAAPIYSSPAVVDGRLYLSTGDRRIVSLDAESGDLVWEHNVNGPVDSSVAVAGDLVFVGLRDGRVLALDRESGEARWEFPTEGPVYSSPAVHEGVLYIGSNDGRLYALEAMTGERRWSFATGGWVLSSPALQEHVVAVTSQDSNLYIVDTRTGKSSLDYKIGLAAGGPVFDGDRVFVSQQEGALSAIDWRETDPPLEDAALFIRTQLVAWGLMESLPAQAGSIWGFYEAGERFPSTPAVAWDKVYVSSASGNLFAMNKATGEKVWEFQADAGLRASPSVSDQTVFLGDVEGRLYAIDANTGERLWDFKVGGTISSTPVIAKGALYVASQDGTLYALK